MAFDAGEVVLHAGIRVRVPHIDEDGNPVRDEHGHESDFTAPHVVGKVRRGGDITVGTTMGPVSASTGNGRIELTVPAGFNAQVDASTGNGGILTDFPIQVTGRISKTRMRGTIGEGGRRLRLVTGNGEIEIRRAG